jgi:NADH:ubiquinone oxidoreductase subunit 3 (subunit A)
LNPLALPVVAFCLALFVALLIYWLGGMMAAPAMREAKHKLEPYACGESVPDVQRDRSYNLFHVAFIFTILHVGVLVAATAPPGEMAWLAVVVASVVAVTAGVLLLRGGEEDA